MYYLAIDIGASSGRHLVWDVEALVESVKQGVAAAKAVAEAFGLDCRKDFLNL